MYAFRYTERHSVWYFAYYCEHFLNDFATEKRKKVDFVTSWQILSCQFFKHFMWSSNNNNKKNICHWSDYPFRAIETYRNPSTTIPRQVRDDADTRGKIVNFLKTWRATASVSGFSYNRERERKKILLFQFENQDFSTKIQKSDLK